MEKTKLREIDIALRKEAKSKPLYEKPLFEKTEGMTFTEEIWKKFSAGRFCMQCSSCHGCAG